MFDRGGCGQIDGRHPRGGGRHPGAVPDGAPRRLQGLRPRVPARQEQGVRVRQGHVRPQTVPEGTAAPPMRGPDTASDANRRVISGQESCSWHRSNRFWFNRRFSRAKNSQTFLFFLFFFLICRFFRFCFSTRNNYFYMDVIKGRSSPV